MSKYIRRLLFSTSFSSSGKINKIKNKKKKKISKQLLLSSIAEYIQQQQQEKEDEMEDIVCDSEGNSENEEKEEDGENINEKCDDKEEMGVNIKTYLLKSKPLINCKDIYMNKIFINSNVFQCYLTPDIECKQLYTLYERAIIDYQISSIKLMAAKLLLTKSIDMIMYDEITPSQDSMMAKNLYAILKNSNWLVTLDALFTMSYEIPSVHLIRQKINKLQTELTEKHLNNILIDNDSNIQKNTHRLIIFDQVKPVHSHKSLNLITIQQRIPLKLLQYDNGNIYPDSILLCSIASMKRNALGNINDNYENNEEEFIIDGGIITQFENSYIRIEIEKSNVLKQLQSIDARHIDYDESFSTPAKVYVCDQYDLWKRNLNTQEFKYKYTSSGLNRASLTSHEFKNNNNKLHERLTKICIENNDENINQFNIKLPTKKKNKFVKEHKEGEEEEEENDNTLLISVMIPCYKNTPVCNNNLFLSELVPYITHIPFISIKHHNQLSLLNTTSTVTTPLT